MIDLSDDQQKALNVMLSGKNCLITGAAGTGKSTVIKAFREKFQKNCVVVAPTGVAALNVKGQTIHSFFMLAPGLQVPDNISPIPYKRKIALIKLVDTIIIDEISMVRSDVFNAIDIRLRQICGKRNESKPFGGKQVICCGDFYQLPPVTSTLFESEWLEENLGGEYVFDTPLWKNADFNTIMLKTQFRQKDDSRFLSILDTIRHGDIISKKFDISGSMESSLDSLNIICSPDKEFDHHPIKLCTTNLEVQKINNEARIKNKNDLYVFNAAISGKFNQDEYPTEDELKLKVGLRVMILCNKKKSKDEFLYVNGDCGEITDIFEYMGESKLRIHLDKGYDVIIGFHEWNKYKYSSEISPLTGKRIIRQSVIGSFVQFPVKLAYAMTIHKAQGMTLECVDLRLGNGCFAHGQLYTALSRCKSMKNLHLERQLNPNDMILDDKVVDFYNSIEHKNDDSTWFEVPSEFKNEMKTYLESLRSKTV